MNGAIDTTSELLRRVQTLEAIAAILLAETYRHRGDDEIAEVHDLLLREITQPPSEALRPRVTEAAVHAVDEVFARIASYRD